MNAFTANVKPGGLNSSSQIRILLCYLLSTITSPITKNEIETALLSEELVNYFELADALGNLCDNGFVLCENNTYTITDKGRDIARTLKSDLPFSVAECAVRAVIRAQAFSHKSAQHKAEIKNLKNGYLLNCSIEDIGGLAFAFSVFLPDLDSANTAKNNFIENGDDIYCLMLAGITGNKELAERILKA